MIVKNCVGELWLETRDTVYVSEQVDSSNLNMKLCIGTLPSPPFQECRFSLWSKEHNSDENDSLTSSFCQLSQEDKTMGTISTKFIEKFSELKLESQDEVKQEVIRVDNNAPEASAVASVENCSDQKVLALDSRSSSTSHKNLPVAKIAIKENAKKPLCLSCYNVTGCNKSTSNQEESVTTKSFNPFSQSLIPRSPDRNGRRHCKVSPCHTVGNDKFPAKQKTPKVNDGFNSLSAHISTQLLHGSGGMYSETNRPKSKEIYWIDSQFSPSSVCSVSSSAYSSPPSSVEYLPPSSVNNIESYSGDNRNPSPGISDFYPTPPHSVFENISSQTNDSFNESSPDYCTSQFDTNDDSLLQFLFSDESLLSTDVPSPFSEISDFDTILPSSTQDRINDLVCYLKNDNINSVIAQVVTNCSKHFDEAADCSGYDSASSHDKSVQKLDTLQNPLTNSHPTKLSPAAAQLPSNAMPYMCNSGNNSVHPSVLLMPVQWQTLPASVQKDRNCPREIRPNIHPMEKEVCAPKKEERCHVVKDTVKINSVYPGTRQHKSVKAKISSTISTDEKKELLTSLLSGTTDVSSKLHSSVKSGNEKLVYVIIESVRTKTKNENFNSRRDNLNPRLSTAEKIQSFVNTQDNLGCTPLYYASFTENNLLVAYILECGADPLIKDYKNGNTPYHIATLRGDSAIKSMELLSFKRNATDVINKKGQSVLIAAVINHGRIYNGVQINGLKLIEHLLYNNHKLSPQDAEGKTALHMAVLKKDVELLKILLAHGTDSVNARLVKDKEGNTILHDAALLANYRLIDTIITHCSELTEIRNNKGKLPYELINENQEKEKNLLNNKLDECGYRDL